MFNRKRLLTKGLVAVLVLAMNISAVGFDFDTAQEIQNEYEVSEVSGGDADETPKEGNDSENENTVPETDSKTKESTPEADGESKESTPEADSESGENTPETDRESTEVNPEADNERENADTENQDVLGEDSASDGDINGDGVADFETPEDEDAEPDKTPRVERDMALEGQAPVEFNTLTDLLAYEDGEIPVGTTVKTKGYAAVGDGGAASYVISTSREYGGMFAPKTKKGKYAQLVLAETINVAQVGIFPDQGVSVLLNELIAEAYKSGIIKTIQFNDGTYMIDDKVFLKSFNYVGTGKTTLNATTKRKSLNNRIFSAEPKKDETIDSFSLTFSKLNFLMETSADHTLKGKETVLLCLTKVNSCKITDCNFKSCAAEVNGGYVSTDLVWLQKSYNLTNLEVSNCSFINQTGKVFKKGEDLKRDRPLGGCLWISSEGNSLDSKMENIKIHDNYFETSVEDEALAIWNGNVKNCEISECTFKSRFHETHNVTAFYRGKFQNCIVKNCKFDIEDGCMYACKVKEIDSPSEVIFDGLEFNLCSGLDATRNNSVFMIQGYSEDKETIPATVKIKNCKATATEGTGFQCFVYFLKAGCKTCDIYKCNVNMPCKYGLVRDNFGRGNIIKIHSNTINTPDRMATFDNSRYVKAAIDGNTINDNPTVYVNHSNPDMPLTSVFYRFSNNICTYGKDINILNSSGIKDKDTVYYYSKDNKYAPNVTVKDVSSGDKLNGETYLHLTEDPDGTELNADIKKMFPDATDDELKIVISEEEEPVDMPEEGKGETPEEKGQGDTPKEKTPEDKPAEETSKTVPVTPGTTETPKTAAKTAPFSVVVDDVTYTIGEDGNATVDAIGEVTKVSINTVTADGVDYPVTKIAAKSCKGNKTLKKLTIGKNVKSIGKNAFKDCKKLKKVTIKANKSLKIKKGAFKGLPEKAKIVVKGLKGKTKDKMIESIKKRTNAEVK